MTKICTKCGVEKPRTEFHRALSRKDGVAVYCRPCDDLVRATNKRKALETLAGRPAPACCEVCGRKSGRRVSWDHNHDTGVFRGWLCHSCNLVLGRMQDSPGWLRALADYLERSGPGPKPYSEWVAAPRRPGSRPTLDDVLEEVKANHRAKAAS